MAFFSSVNDDLNSHGRKRKINLCFTRGLCHSWCPKFIRNRVQYEVNQVFVNREKGTGEGRTRGRAWPGCQKLFPWPSPGQIKGAFPKGLMRLP